jgi:hypothetical protein
MSLTACLLFIVIAVAIEKIAPNRRMAVTLWIVAGVLLFVAPYYIGACRPGHPFERNEWEGLAVIEVSSSERGFKTSKRVPAHVSARAGLYFVDKIYWNETATSPVLVSGFHPSGKLGQWSDVRVSHLGKDWEVRVIGDAPRR